MKPLALSLPLLVGAALAQSTLTLYTSTLLADVNALVEAFQARNPGVRVQVFRSGSGEVIAKLRAELEAGNPQPDLVWLASEEFLAELAQKGLLRRVPPTTPGFPVQFAYRGGLYYDVRLQYNAIAVNTQRVKNPPRLWQDLLRPEYRGLLAMPDPNFSGAASVAVGTLAGRLGWEFFEGLKAQGLQVEQSNPVLQQKLARGEYGLAITLDYGVRQEIARGAPLTVIYPRDGAILVPTPIGVTSWSKNPELAVRFLSFLLSLEGQRIFVERGYYAVIPGVPTPAGAPEKVNALKGQEATLPLLNRFNALFGLRR